MKIFNICAVLSLLACHMLVTFKLTSTEVTEVTTNFVERHAQCPNVQVTIQYRSINEPWYLELMLLYLQIYIFKKSLPLSRLHIC